jgi:hypothetical protein
MRNRIRYRNSIVLLFVSGAFFLAGCGTKTINHIMADPSRYANKDVRVEGEVVESYSVIGRGAYRIDDGTGKLWIVAPKGVPRKGARVKAKGKIRDGYNLGDLVKLPEQLESGLVMIEKSHKAKD